MGEGKWVFSSLIHSVAIVLCSWRPNAWASHAHKKNTIKVPHRGLGGGPEYLFYPESYSFCDLKLHAKFHNPRTTLSGRKVCGGEKKKRRIRSTEICSKFYSDILFYVKILGYLVIVLMGGYRYFHGINCHRGNHYKETFDLGHTSK